MTECTQEAFEFPALKRRKVQAEFSGGDITSDGGVLLLRERSGPRISDSRLSVFCSL